MQLECLIEKTKAAVSFGARTRQAGGNTCCKRPAGVSSSCDRVVSDGLRLRACMRARMRHV